jgi:hypothetical protein
MILLFHCKGAGNFVARLEFKVPPDGNNEHTGHKVRLQNNTGIQQDARAGL